jgi:ABC-type ATPase involved in cell division
MPWRRRDTTFNEQDPKIARSLIDHCPLIFVNKPTCNLNPVNSKTKKYINPGHRVKTIFKELNLLRSFG